MRPSRAALAGIVVSACFGVACSLLTHAYDYQVGSEPDAAPLFAFPAACGACGDHPDFARSACVPEGGVGTASTRHYLLDTIQLGTRGWTNDAFAAGTNQDCADRPDGGVARCGPSSPLTPFPSLPHGIENAFATQMLAPMTQSFPDAGDVEDQVNAWIAAGLGGFVLVVEGWDGSSDAAVRVRIAPVVGAGPLIGTPSAASVAAQITAGHLDAELDQAALVPLVFGSTSGALLTLNLFGARITGTISDGAIESLVISGYLESGGQLGSAFEQNLAELALGCVGGGVDAGVAKAKALEPGAFDLPDPTGCTKTICGSCVRMSFGMSAHGTRLAAPAVVTPDGRSSCPVEAGGPDGGGADGDAGDADVTTD